ncbi:MAG TPA: tetraacyldisaccharide 4'-kinase [Desulfocapsa sulfexigens]|nr:tetraacyldisaccharide 4'-kinase [Desulfocapsa sulfexigens]
MSQKFSSLYFFGRPFSPLYSGIMKLRESFYLKGFKRRYKLDVPVISVGNLTMGGTGKTPVVALLASMLLEKGFKPAIISRGYGGTVNNKVNIVSDGKDIFLDAASAGDEPCFLAKSLPGVPVLTGIVRVLPCRHAIETFGCTVLILDDGFQHLSVERNLDLVLFSAATLAGNSRVFPGGDLREPVSALKRCDAFIITGVTDEFKERSKKFTELLKKRFPDKPVFHTTYQAMGAISLEDDTLKEIVSLPTPLFGFCGIAQPELFQKTVAAQNISLSGFMPLRDHQPFKPGLINKITSQALSTNATGLLTTEKDLIKLKKNTFDLPCFALKMEVQGDQDLLTFLDEQIKVFLP